MADLWGGRFTQATDEEVFAFNESLSFDRRLFREDIRGSMAHARMLCRQGIITKEDEEAILGGLERILKELEEEGFKKEDLVHEDIHSLVEAKLIALVGEPGKKLHTGRSRNDQVALDMKMYVRGQLDRLCLETEALLETLYGLMEKHRTSYMPGFTHLQKAQPVSLAHYLGAYFEMFRRDHERFSGLLSRMGLCPLGSGALAGTTYPLDREYTASLLDFEGPTRNSMDSVADRDYVLEALSDCSILMMHLSRFSEELILWNSNEYGFVEMDDGFSTGSSIMPQKKNPDVAELIRGKTGRVYGDMLSLFTVLKGIPLAYNKDMQEDKESFFDAADTALTCVRLFTGMLKTISFRTERMKESALKGFSNATDAADYLVEKGVAFRDAHGIVGRMVLFAIEKKVGLEELSLEELKGFSPKIEEDFYRAVSLEACVERRNTPGAPGSEAMERELREAKVFIEGIKQERTLKK